MKQSNHSIDVGEILFSKEERQTGLPFFVMLIGVLIILYVLALTSTPRLREPSRLIPLTLIFVLHGALYIYSLYLQKQRERLPIYIVVQMALIYAISNMIQGEGYVLGLYLALAGEVVGFYFNELKLAAFWASAILLLAAINFVLLWGWYQALSWLAWMLPMNVFVVIYVVIFSRQARARVVAQALVRELEQAQAQLKEYAAQVETLTLTNERQRIARELHDTLAQGLVGVILQLEAVEARLLNDEAHQALSLVGQAKERARGTLAEARSAIRDLRQQAQTFEEFERNLQEEVSRFSETTGIACQLQVPQGPKFPAEYFEQVSRLVAESLANTARHAQASNAWVHLIERGSELCVEVGDDGIGFNLRDELGKPDHYGLVGLRERARLAGGNLEIHSSPDQGTTIRLCLPAGEGDSRE